MDITLFIIGCTAASSAKSKSFQQNYGTETKYIYSFNNHKANSEYFKKPASFNNKANEELIPGTSLKVKCLQDPH